MSDGVNLFGGPCDRDGCLRNDEQKLFGGAMPKLISISSAERRNVGWSESDRRNLFFRFSISIQSPYYRLLTGFYTGCPGF